MRGVLNALLPDVYVFTDHAAGPAAALSPGFAVSLVAETTTGCLISAECAATGNADEAAIPEEVAPRPIPRWPLHARRRPLFVEKLVERTAEIA